MPLSCKGSVALLAGVLPALFCFSHALPPRQIARGSGPPPQFSTPAHVPVPIVGWITGPSHGAAVRSAASTSRNHHQQEGGRESSMPRWCTRVTLSSPPSAFARCRRKRPRRRTFPTLHNSVGPGLEGGGVGPPSAAAAAAVSHVGSPTTTTTVVDSASQRAASAATAGSNSKTASPGVVVENSASRPSARRELRSKGSSSAASSPTAGGPRSSRDFFAASAAATTSSGSEASSASSSTTTADKEEEELRDESEAVTVADDDKGAATCLLLEGIDRVVEVAGHRVRLRVATLDDYLAIADVRFNVFSPVHSTLKHRFRERSCVLMTERRRRGAFCLVVVLERAENAEAERDGVVTGVITEEHVLGTLECSRHEFDGTALEVEQEEAETLPRYDTRLLLVFICWIQV